MNPFQFDPSKMDPKALMELSQLVQQLPPERLNRMQTLMHNMMAGYDVRAEMEEFEKGLPPDFRAKVTALMAGQAGAYGAGATQAPMFEPEVEAQSSTQEVSSEMNMREARLTILRAVSEQRLSPEEAEKLLFNAS